MINNIFSCNKYNYQKSEKIVFSGQHEGSKHFHVINEINMSCSSYKIIEVSE